jgi:hypothetical protein
MTRLKQKVASHQKQYYMVQKVAVSRRVFHKFLNNDSKLSYTPCYKL